MASISRVLALLWLIAAILMVSFVLFVHECSGDSCNASMGPPVVAAFLVLGLSGIVIVPLGLWSFGLAYAHRESRIPRPSTRI
jgi:hypothetical protein